MTGNGIFAFEIGSSLLFGLAEFGQDAVVFESGRIAYALFAGGDVAEEAAHDFAGAGLRE